MKTIRNYSLIAFAFSLLAAGCATEKPSVVYVASDRRIESCTNSAGIACKAVPDPVFVEMLEKIQELKDLKKERKIDARLSTTKN